MFFKKDRVGIRAAFAVSNVIFEKTLHVSFNQNPTYSLGDIITYGTSDSLAFGGVSLTLIYLVSIPISSLMGFTYLYFLFGVALFPGIAGFTIMMIFNYFYVKRNLHFQKEYLQTKGKRLKLLEEVITNIRFVKTAVLEFFFLNRLELVRKTELKWIKKMAYRTVFVIFNAWFSPALMTFLMFVFFIYFGNQLSVSVIFTSLIVMRTYQSDLTFLPNVFGTFIDYMVSSERITNFLLSDDIKKLINSHDCRSEYDVNLKNIAFFWPESEQKEKIENIKEPLIIKEEIQKFELLNVNIEVKKGELIAVIGKSGAGKSSLLLGLIGEMLSSASSNSLFSVNENIAYLSQSPWIFNETVRENITVGKGFNPELFQDVIHFCKLERDINSMKKGVETAIGSKGVDVSGGQKVRIAFARTLYSDREVYLLDDPLSAFDSRVGEFIFNETICGYLKNKTRIVTTHSVKHLPFFDRIIFLEAGRIIYQGDYEGLTKLYEFQTFLKIVEETTLKNEVKKEDDSKVQSENLNSSKSVTDLASLLEFSSDDLKLFAEKRSKAERLLYQNMDTEMAENQPFSFRSVKNYIFLGSKTLFFFSVFSNFLFFLLNWFIFVFYNEQSRIKPADFNFDYFLKILLFIQIGSTVLPTLRGYFILLFGVSVSKKLSLLINFRVIHASLLTFFNKNSSGKILNRLGGDIEHVDKSIPVILSQQLNLTFFVLLQFSLMIYYSSIYVSFFIAVYILIVFSLQRRFVETLKQLTKLDTVSKSPFYNLLSDIIYGIVDIRVLKLQKHVRLEMREIIDNHVRCGYTLAAAYKWFRMRVALLSLIFVIPCLLFLLYGGTEAMSTVPIVLVALIQNIEYLIDFINITNETEKSMVIFGRCENYLEIPSELGCCQIASQMDDLRTHQSLIRVQKMEEAILNEPFKGYKIEFKDLSASYSKDGPPVLSNLNFSLKKGEKIGVIGRTGAGKSSLTNVLFQFFEILNGQVQIDGRDIYKLNAKFLRSNLTYISQDSYFFEGTIRENIDMFGVVSDADLKLILEEAEIFEKIQSLGGLDSILSKNGGSLSVGEKQILCFVRAIVNLKNIVIMDEATSSLDVKSEQVLEKMKQRYFNNCSVITIAHRLNTLFDSHRIIELEKGKIKNIRIVNELKDNQKSAFLSDFFN